VAERNPARAENTHRSAATRTLIAATHRLFVETLAAVLVRHGYEIVGLGGSATEAVELARRSRPDLVLLELGAFGRDAIEAGRSILAELPRTKIVAMSPVADLRTIHTVVDAGFHGLVSQESGIGHLTSAMHAVAAGDTVFPALGRWEVGPEAAGRSEGRRFATLTGREREVLRLLSHGDSTRVIASRLHIAPQTVRSHVQGVLTKLEVHSRLEAVALARRMGLAAPATP
jgi:DNA-binding NarL/FixJ family response regulator